MQVMSTNAVMSTVGRFQESDMGLNYVGVSLLYCVFVCSKVHLFQSHVKRGTIHTLMTLDLSCFVFLHTHVFTPIDG